MRYYSVLKLTHDIGCHHLVLSRKELDDPNIPIIALNELGDVAYWKDKKWEVITDHWVFQRDWIHITIKPMTNP
jgi:hypothetical protein